MKALFKEALPEEYLKRYLGKNLRIDGRQFMESRKIQIMTCKSIINTVKKLLAFIKNVHGSCIAMCGSTSILCTNT